MIKKLSKTQLFWLSLGIISIGLGWLFMSVGFNRAPGGDDKDFFTKMYLFTKDESYISLFFTYFKDCFHHITHPADYMRYFCLTTMNYAVWKFAALNLTNYRIVILIYTYVAVVLTAIFVHKLTNNMPLAISSIAIVPFTVNLIQGIEVNPIYTYQAITQRTYIYWILGMICMLTYNKNRKLIFLILSGIGMFASCMVLEVGYILIAPSFFIILGLDNDLKTKIKLFAPEFIAVIIAFIGYIVCVKNNGMVGDTAVHLRLSPILITATKQFFSANSILPIVLSEFDFHFYFINLTDFITSLLLAVILIVSLSRTDKLNSRLKGCVYMAGLSMMIFPALLMGLVEKFQKGTFITWRTGWIVSIIQLFGEVLFFTVLFSDICTWVKENIPIKFFTYLVMIFGCLIFTAVGSTSRASARFTSENNRQQYEVLQESLRNGLLNNVAEGSTIVCNFNVWGSNESAQSNYIEVSSGKALKARVYHEDITEVDQWYLATFYHKTNSYTYVGKINDNSIESLSNVSIWVVADSYEELSDITLSYVSEADYAIPIDTEKIINLPSGRYGYLMELPDHPDSFISNIEID